MRFFWKIKHRTADIYLKGYGSVKSRLKKGLAFGWRDCTMFRQLSVELLLTEIPTHNPVTIRLFLAFLPT